MATEEALPAHVALLVDFVNTVELEGGPEALGSPAELSAWLRAQGLLGAGRHAATAADLEQARGLREALREVWEAHHDGAPASAEAARRLDRATAELPLRLAVRPGEHPRLVPVGTGVRAALGGVVAAVATSVGDGSWDRLKACRRESCRWGFYDASRNHSRSWCSMGSCGNKAKVSAYRSRRRAAGVTAP